MPASFGPGVLAPGANSPEPPMPWHEVQPFFTNSFSPHFSGAHSSAVPWHLSALSRNFLYSSGVTTLTVASMFEWLVPQNSAQKTCALPTVFGVNEMNEYCPGTASRFMRNSGMKNEWMTSSDEMII